MTKDSPQMTDEEIDDFQCAFRRVGALLAKLDREGVCPCCAGKALSVKAAIVCMDAIGTDAAIAIFEQGIAFIRDGNVPAPDQHTHH